MVKKSIALLKTFIAYIIFIFMKKKRNICLICEKKNEARDNGMYFFLYAMQQNDNYEKYYLISKNSVDRCKLNDYKSNLIRYDSLKHYVYFFLASKIVSSQSFPFPTNERVCDHLKSNFKNYYWLQHGVTKDYSPERNYKLPFFSKMNLVCCESEQERKFFIEKLDFPSSVALCTGFCRYDGLINTLGKRQILVMPTFRKWLAPKNHDKPSKKEQKNFINSHYYNQYSTLLNDKKLNEILEKKDIDLIFYPHWSIQPFAELFKTNSSHVVIAKSKDYDVQALLNSSNILVTDFSSIFFDFAYLKKPVIYFHFDKDEYNRGHYQEGYFSYKNDGFGDIAYDYVQLINLIFDSISLDFKMSNKYLDRRNNFFNINDRNNSKRVYNIVFGENKI